jgi:aspartate/methionine/tyrosine aminotransferase
MTRPILYKKMFDYEYRFKEFPNLLRLEGSDYDTNIYHIPNIYQKAAEKIFSINYGTSYSWLGGNDEAKDIILKYESSILKIADGDPPMVFIGGGISSLVSLTIEAILELNQHNPQKNEVVLFFPDYPLYHSAVMATGAIPKPIFANRQNNFLVTTDELESAVTEKTMAVLFANPNNPTCKTYSRDWIKKIIDLSQKYDFFIISDEIYSHMLYNFSNFTHIASQKGNYKNLIKMFGPSKDRPGATGLRMGYCIGDRRLYGYLHDIQMIRNFSNNAISDYIFSVDMAMRLFRRTKYKQDILYEFSSNDIDEYSCAVEKNKEIQLENNRAIIEYLKDNQHVSDIIEPDGGNLVFFRYYKNMPSEKLFQEFINKGLAIYPSDVFNIDSDKQGSWIRICVTRSKGYLKKAIKLI